VKDMRQKAHSLALSRLDRLAAAIPKGKRVLIVPHDYPDPDALAAAAAFHVLLAERFGIASSIAFSGQVSRAENKELLRRMQCRWQFMDEVRATSRSIPAIVVDTTPWSRNVTIPAFVRPVGVIDHHQHSLRPSSSAMHVDIRAGAGATTTIAYEYLEAARADVPRWLASIMAYAIASETLDLSRDSEPADLDAYGALIARADLKIIGKIRHAPLPRAYYSHLQEAISNARRVGNVVWSHLRSVEQPEIIAEVADLLLRMEGMRWSFCTAYFNGGMMISLRSSQRGARCSHVLRSAVLSSGSAGGHHRMAAGYLPMGKLSLVERENRRRALVAALACRMIRPTPKDPGALDLLAQRLVEPKR
jgi:nanoRNase/pAp phosphatase (c-di-AMP/oligoRNAs hydrolase)